jgi:hypothetical protein
MHIVAHGTFRPVDEADNAETVVDRLEQRAVSRLRAQHGALGRIGFRLRPQRAKTNDLAFEFVSGQRFQIHSKIRLRCNACIT